MTDFIDIFFFAIVTASAGAVIEVFLKPILYRRRDRMFQKIEEIKSMLTELEN